MAHASLTAVRTSRPVLSIHTSRRRRCGTCVADGPHATGRYIQRDIALPDHVYMVLAGKGLTLTHAGCGT